MPSDNEQPQIATLRAANAELETSLGRCRELLEEARTRLAANSNERIAHDEPLLFGKAPADPTQVRE